MEVQLSPEQQALVQHAIETGRLDRPEEAMREALSLWEERERRRLDLVAHLEEAEASFARGEGRRVTAREEVIQLADDIKRRARVRLASETKIQRLFILSISTW
jgi:Arc/MetJ-type ribon-helix-helix transcriptional regulator